MSLTYAAEQWLPFPIELVFTFFANPENLPRLMPTWQKARIDQASYVSPPPYPHEPRPFAGTAAGAGTRLTLSFRPVPFSPIRIPWDAEISEFAWNDHFCDIQHRGPFAAWRHCHRLTPQSRPESTIGTLLHDEVQYEPPFGPLGRLAQPLIARQLAYMFRVRHKRTAELLPLMAARAV